MTAPKRIAVVLFQLGGPDTLDAVEPFLYNLFCDPDIINFPGAFLARKPLAKLISTQRSKVVREHYAEIGGGSPIRRLTEQQGRALEEALRPHIPARAIVAMRYWHPDTTEAIAALDSEPFDELVLLPLYPHYSFATTGSSLKEWNRLYQPKVPVRLIEHFFDHPDYIAGLVERVNEVLGGLPNPEEVQLVFSAHGLPMVLVEKGDPYPRHIEATVQLVRQLGAWDNPHVLCFQSKVGPQKWLQPSLTSTIERMAHEGVRRMLVIPISFVTDHIETLHEIDIEARAQAESLGVRDFHMTAGLNDSPLLIRALADLVLRTVGMRAGVASPGVVITANRSSLARDGTLFSSISTSLVLCFILAGCGSKQSQESSQPSAPAEPVLTLDPTTTGSITGKVVLDGSPPAPKAIDMGAEAACVQEHPTPVDFPSVVEGNRGALANVAVYVKSGLGNYHFDTPKDPVVLTQKGCMYDPHVLSLMVNQPLQVVNADPVLHNIHVVARDNRSWNRSETAGMDPFEETFSHPELGVVIKCNVHPWMRAFAFVFNHPYFDVTTKTGTFELKSLPPGTYTIEAWQEKYGVQDQTVTIGPKESKAISFTFKTPASAPQ